MTTITKTMHKPDCNRVFKNYDMSCARCVELSTGSAPRAAWFTPRPQRSEVFKSCGHDAINPGGYCNVCGNGRDFS